jgi:hypothetical protein
LFSSKRVQPRPTTSGSIGFSDINGNHYQTEKYILPEIKIGGLRIYDVHVKEEGDGFRKNARLQGCEDKKIEEEFDRKIVGRLGTGMFLDDILGGLFMDLGHSKFFIIKDIALFQEDGYSIKNMLKIPYEWNHGFVIELETDFGKEKFLLDTGFSCNVIKESLVGETTPVEIQGKLKMVTSSKFQIGGEDFGAEEFYSYSITPEMEGIDGILGMPFFKKYALFLDLKNDVAYIASSQEKDSGK